MMSKGSSGGGHGGSYPSPNPLGFLSTHNALRVSPEDERIWTVIRELGPRGGRAADGGGGRAVGGAAAGGGSAAASGRSVAFYAYPFQDVEMLKRRLIHEARLPHSTNVGELRLLFRGAELPNHRSLATLAAGEQSRVRFWWAYADADCAVGVREQGLRPPPRLRGILAELELALQRGVAPRLTLDGTGGTYILSGAARGAAAPKALAVFKPLDEEPFAPNNPRGYVGKLGQKGFRAGVLSGEGAQREVAGFLLDAQYNNFASVPETTKVRLSHPALCYAGGGGGGGGGGNAAAAAEAVSCDGDGNAAAEGASCGGASGAAAGAVAGAFRRRHHHYYNPHHYYKEGSLQEFVGNGQLCGDFDPGVFATSDAHRIAIFDLTVLNMDRNDCNILVVPRDASRAPSLEEEDAHRTPSGRVSKFKLVPIDHGLILPDSLDVAELDLVWYHWPQSRLPFSRAELRHIFALDPDKDAGRLARKLAVRPGCLRTLRAAVRTLQLGAAMRLNVQQIASVMVRGTDLEQPSDMERLIKSALVQTVSFVNALALTQQDRVPGGVVTDLIAAGGAAGGGGGGAGGGGFGVASAGSSGVAPFRTAPSGVAPNGASSEAFAGSGRPGGVAGSAGSAAAGPASPAPPAALVSFADEYAASGAGPGAGCEGSGDLSPLGSTGVAADDAAALAALTAALRPLPPPPPPRAAAAASAGRELPPHFEVQISLHTAATNSRTGSSRSGGRPASSDGDDSSSDDSSAARSSSTDSFSSFVSAGSAPGDAAGGTAGGAGAIGGAAGGAAGGDNTSVGRTPNLASAVGNASGCAGGVSVVSVADSSSAARNAAGGAAGAGGPSGGASGVCSVARDAPGCAGGIPCAFCSIPVSRITGIPLDSAFDVPAVWERLRRRGERAPRPPAPPAASAAEEAAAPLRQQRTAGLRTARRPRPRADADDFVLSATWSLVGSNKKRIEINWDDPAFDRALFDCFESLVWKHIRQTWPEAAAAPWNGSQLLREMAASRSPYHRRIAAKAGAAATAAAGEAPPPAAPLSPPPAAPPPPNRSSPARAPPSARARGVR